MNFSSSEAMDLLPQKASSKGGGKQNKTENNHKKNINKLCDGGEGFRRGGKGERQRKFTFFFFFFDVVVVSDAPGKVRCVKKNNNNWCS